MNPLYDNIILIKNTAIERTPLKTLSKIILYQSIPN